jgi:hypothetical protein
MVRGIYELYGLFAMIVPRMKKAKTTKTNGSLAYQQLKARENQSRKKSSWKKCCLMLSQTDTNMF